MDKMEIKAKSLTALAFSRPCTYTDLQFLMHVWIDHGQFSKDFVSAYDLERA
jgi:hypothetical protein